MLRVVWSSGRSSRLSSVRTMATASTTNRNDLRARMKRQARRPVSEYRPSDDDAETFTFPREKLGNTYALNWALNRYTVTPEGAAYHNLPAESIVARSRGALNKNKALVIDEPSGNYGVYYVDHSDADNSISLDNYRKLSLHLRSEHLSEADKIFAHDGAIGNATTSALGVRVITDDGPTALLASHTLSRVRAYDDPQQFPHQFTVFATSALTIDDPKAYGLRHERAIFINLRTGTIVSYGAPRSAVLDALSTAFAHRVVAPSQTAPPPPKDKDAEPEQPPPLDAVPVRADAVEYGGASALVFGATDTMRSGGLRRFLAGPTVNLWREDGIAPLYAGSMFHNLPDESSQRSDLVLRNSDGRTSTTTRCASHRSALPPPKAVVLVVDDSSLPASAAVSSLQAAKHIVAGYRGGKRFSGSGLSPAFHWAPVAEKLEKLLSSSGAGLFVVNVADGNGSAAALEKTLLSIFNGKFKPASDGAAKYESNAAKAIDAQLKQQKF